jgi:hypothetical protein
MVKKLVLCLSLLIALGYWQLQSTFPDTGLVTETVNSPIKNQLLRPKLSAVENGNQINTDRTAAIALQNKPDNFLIMEPSEQLPADHYGAYSPMQHGHEHIKHPHKDKLTPPGEPRKILLSNDLVR